MKLEKNECVFVVFRDKGQPSAFGLDDNYPVPEKRQVVENDWNVAFKSAFKTPSPIRMSRLSDLSESENDSVRYFSGTATYTTATVLDKPGGSKRMLMCFGNVGAMAKVYINDKYAGGVWTAPYKLDVTDFVENGKNTIRVEVVNTWVNRIVGDLNAPESDREVYCFVNPHKADTPLPLSGLVGEVVFETVKY